MTTLWKVLIGVYSRLIRKPKSLWAWRRDVQWCHPPMIPRLARSIGDSSSARLLSRMSAFWKWYKFGVNRETYIEV